MFEVDYESLNQGDRVRVEPDLPHRVPPVAGPALPPARPLRLLPPRRRIHDHPRRPHLTPPALHQVSHENRRLSSEAVQSDTSRQ